MEEKATGKEVFATKPTALSFLKSFSQIPAARFKVFLRHFSFLVPVVHGTHGLGTFVFKVSSYGGSTHGLGTFVFKVSSSVFSSPLVGLIIMDNSYFESHA